MHVLATSIGVMFALHNDLRLWYRCAYVLVRKYSTTINVQFILNDHIFTQHWNVLHTDLQENELVYLPKKTSENFFYWLVFICANRFRTSAHIKHWHIILHVCKWLKNYIGVCGVNTIMDSCLYIVRLVQEPQKKVKVQIVWSFLAFRLEGVI